MALLAVGVIGGLALLGTAQRQIEQAARRSAALGLAESKLEQLRAAAWDALPLGTLDDRSDGYHRSWEVERVRPGMARLAVTVDWTDEGGHRRVVRLARLRAAGTAP